MKPEIMKMLAQFLVVADWIEQCSEYDHLPRFSAEQQQEFGKKMFEAITYAIAENDPDTIGIGYRFDINEFVTIYGGVVEEKEENNDSKVQGV